jgi:hypothetical protein
MLIRNEIPYLKNEMLIIYEMHTIFGAYRLKNEIPPDVIRREPLAP